MTTVTHDRDARLQDRDADLTGAVAPLDRLAMHVGLALLLWSARRTDRPRPAGPARPALIPDARWYLS